MSSNFDLGLACDCVLLTSMPDATVDSWGFAQGVQSGLLRDHRLGAALRRGHSPYSGNRAWFDPVVSLRLVVLWHLLLKRLVFRLDM